LEFGFGAGDQDEVESFLGELDSIFFADTVRCASNDSPTPLLSISAKLLNVLESEYTK
jgi:hypothetical protein